MSGFKKYNSTNFFKHTFCEFHQVDDFSFPVNCNYKSKSESKYYYTEEGVYRKSNHWGRVANCRWKLIAKNNYKNQNEVIGFAKWTDFYPINSDEKRFFILVDFENKTVKLKPKTETSHQYLYSYSEALNRIKQIQQLLKNDKWATHFDMETDILRVKVISKFITSNHTLLEIKRSFK